MSKVIKKTVISDDIIKIDDAPVKKTKKLPKKPRLSTEDSLDFKGQIDSAIDNYVSLIEKSKVEKTLQNKYDQGYKDGQETEYSDREKYIDDLFSDTLKVIETLLSDAKEKKRNAFRDTEEKLISLAINIADQIIHKSVEAEPELLVAIVTEVMEQMLSSEKVVLKVAAQDYTLINSKYDKWFGLAGNVKEFRIEIDKRLSAGDCLIETEGGIIDGVISSRLSVLADELLKINK
ncbi:FliH/SctL family protein [Candidatus Latescibacterota bacterium]